MSFVASNFTRYLVISLYLTFTSIHEILEAKDGAWCTHCDCPEHVLDTEKCLQCGRLVIDCDYRHSVACLHDDNDDFDTEKVVEKLKNAGDESTLIKLICYIVDEQKKNNIYINTDDAFDSTMQYLINENVPIQKNHVEHFRRLINGQRIINDSQRANSRLMKKPVEPELPAEVKVGYLIAHGGFCVSVLPYSGCKWLGNAMIIYGGKEVIEGYKKYGYELSAYYESVDQYKKEQFEIEEKKKAERQDKKEKKRIRKEEKKRKKDEKRKNAENS